jgi:hypothetical protein
LSISEAPERKHSPYPLIARHQQVIPDKEDKADKKCPERKIWKYSDNKVLTFE